MIDRGPIDGSRLTMKGFVSGHIIKARCALQELKRPLKDSDIEAIIGWLQTAEETLEYLTDPEEETNV
jgi:hypothetical protein